VSRSVNYRQDNNFRLTTLGRLTLVGPGGVEDESLKNKRVKLALLTVLALALRPISRDTLVGMFWGEQEEARARHSLSDALSHLRRVLGRDAIVAGKSDVALGEAVRVSVDASELMDAVTSGDMERACALYHGRFLETAYFAGGEAFRNWVDGEQRRLETLFLKACAEQCQTLARARRWDACAELSARWLAAAPLSSDAALFLLNALKAPATRDADQRALAEFDRLTARLRDEYGRNPDRAVAALARDITERLKATDATGEFPTALPRAEQQKLLPRVEATAISDASVAAAAPATTVGIRALAPTFAPRPSRSHRLAIIGGAAAAAVLFALAAFASFHRSSNTATRDSRPSIAIAGVRDLRPDSGASWMAEGLAQMMASKLGRSAELEVVAPDRVRDVKVRAQVERRAQLSLDELRDLGRRLGATWVVQGGLTGGRVGSARGDNGASAAADSLLMLDVAVYDVATGQTVRSFAVGAPDILRLADAGAARLLEAAGANTPGPHLSEVETASLEAYEHYARYQVAASEGRGNDAVRELDAAIALDSGFITALRERTNYALVRGDHPMVERLGAAFRRNSARATEWDRLWMAIQEAFHGGERTKSVTLATQFVERYPHDPRAFGLLAEILGYQGRFTEAARVLREELALDSLATLAGRGMCLPCQAYGGLAFMLSQAGDDASALRATQRVVELQPELAGAWATHASLLAQSGQFAGAFEAVHRALALSGGDDEIRAVHARLLMAGRRLRDADSVIAGLERSASPDARRVGFDLRFMLEREQGRFRASTVTIHRMLAAFPDSRELQLVEGNNLGRIGDYTGARRLYEAIHHVPRPPGDPPVPPGVGDAARSFSWHHALLGDAIAPGGDTAYLRALADSIETVSARSYYGRDARLPHHLRGLIAARAGRYDDAVREFEAARWGRAGWTRTLVELAKAELARGRAARAVNVLRDAYHELPDAMGRYAPRSEIDYWMATAFRRVGQADSAASYERYLRDAWANAEPEAKKLLAELARGTTPNFSH
jgi:DNA-binding SARP family transcriptional activator/Flp pilus assembly protein TadD/TolB-like protein